MSLMNYDILNELAAQALDKIEKVEGALRLCWVQGNYGRKYISGRSESWAQEQVHKLAPEERFICWLDEEDKYKKELAA